MLRFEVGLSYWFHFTKTENEDINARETRR